MTSGPLESMTLAGRRFACDAEDDTTIELGGFNNTVKPNGDGSIRLQKGRIAASVSGANIMIDNDRGDMEYLRDLRNRMDLFDFSATEVDGTVYSGSMQLVDDLPVSLKEGTAAISLNGSVEKQG